MKQNNSEIRRVNVVLIVFVVVVVFLAVKLFLELVCFAFVMGLLCVNNGDWSP